MLKDKILGSGLVASLVAFAAMFSGCATLAAAGGEEAGSSSIWSMLILVVVFFAMMYFLSIRPQRKRQKEHRRMMDEMQRGDKVITAGGIYGLVERVDADAIVIKVESGGTLRVAKGSVSVKLEN